MKDPGNEVALKQNKKKFGRMLIYMSTFFDRFTIVKIQSSGTWKLYKRIINSTVSTI